MLMRKSQIYWLGPILGSLLVSRFYKFIKMLEYKTANPGQDFNKEELLKILMTAYLFIYRGACYL